MRNPLYFLYKLVFPENVLNTFLLWFYRQKHTYEYLFVSDKNRTKDDNILRTQAGVNYAWHVVCEKAGVKYITSHEIRFSNVTQQSKDGVSTRILSKQCGHSDESMTNHYILEYDKQVLKQVIDNQRYIDDYMSRNNILTYSDIQERIKERPQTAYLLSVWGLTEEAWAGFEVLGLLETL